MREMINWTQELQGKSPQGSMDVFQQHLNVAVDRWVPVKKVKHLPMLDKNLSG